MASRRVRTARTLASVAGALTLSACGAQIIVAGDTSVLVAQHTRDGGDGQVSGELEPVGRCLGVAGAVVVWPYGTEVVTDQPLRVDVPRYGILTAGDEVTLAGGFASEEPDTDDPDLVAGVPVPTDCADYDVFVAH